ncbi:MAG: rhodanese-like domain-containing protein [Acidimicrobiia bacterium]|nr:rhodanese-like domain-containing protein [Acidimicrobiia bacterium]
MDEPAIPEVTADEARTRLEAGALLVDVREEKEWQRARIPGAVFKPMSQLNAWWQELPTDRDVILQCRTGDRSARITAALTTQAGMTNVLNLAGGIIAWHEAGFDVET